MHRFITLIVLASITFAASVAAAPPDVSAGEMVEWRPSPRKSVVEATSRSVSKSTGKSMVETTRSSAVSKSTSRLNTNTSGVRTNVFLKPQYTDAYLRQLRSIGGYRVCPGGRCGG